MKHEGGMTKKALRLVVASAIGVSVWAAPVVLSAPAATTWSVAVDDPIRDIHLTLGRVEREVGEIKTPLERLEQPELIPDHHAVNAPFVPGVTHRR